MAGGAGTRFWPASRIQSPKQLLRVQSSRSLIEETIRRIRPLIPPGRILILTQKSQYPAIRKAIPEIPKQNFVVEPVGRNTAASLGWGALVVLARDPQAVIVCLPADQLIRDDRKFLRAIRSGILAARSGEDHVTLGIIPKAPETGYGYIERGDLCMKQNGISVYEAKRFVEKPDLVRARKFLKSGRFYWNSGIFIWKVQFLLSELAKHAPGLLRKLKKIASPRDLSKIYPTLPAISIDYAVLEKASGVLVIPGDFGWQDIGSWSAFEHLWPKDASNNASPKQIIAVNSSNNIVNTDSKLAALVGVDNLIVIETKDAILVASKDKAQQVRKVIEELKKQKLNRYL